MAGRPLIHYAMGITFTVFVAVVGCQTLHNAGVPGLEPYIKPDPVEVAKEQSHRENFQTHRDHKALYWLLSNRIANGMQLHEVEEILGGPGEFTTDFNSNNSDGIHHATDSSYKWGPDSSGYSVVVFILRDTSAS